MDENSQAIMEQIKIPRKWANMILPGEVKVRFDKMKADKVSHIFLTSLMNLWEAIPESDKIRILEIYANEKNLKEGGPNENKEQPSDAGRA